MKCSVFCRRWRARLQPLAAALPRRLDLLAPFRISRFRFKAVNAEGPERERGIGEGTALRRRALGDRRPGAIGSLADRQEIDQAVGRLVGFLPGCFEDEERVRRRRVGPADALPLPDAVELRPKRFARELLLNEEIALRHREALLLR